ncbi:MAG: class I SAM-dependent methyltransferase [bacterium]|nr:class I SAM-dependent methyltransferase [bacterium]
MSADRDGYRGFHRKRHEAILALLERHVPAKAPRLLDIGSGGDVAGAGAFIQERFADEIHTVDLGVDVATGAGKGLIAKTCNVDREPLPYPDAHFDIVLFASVIEHLYNPHFALSEIARVTRPSGVLLIEAPNAVALGRRFDALAGRNPFARFNQYNALEEKGVMEYCAVFYTAEEAGQAIAPWFDVAEVRYAMHSPRTNPLKTLLRATAFRLNPRLGDCFMLLGKKR